MWKCRYGILWMWGVDREGWIRDCRYGGWIWLGGYERVDKELWIGTSGYGNLFGISILD